MNVPVGGSRFNSSINKEALVPLARNPVSAIREKWNRRGGGPEVRAEKAKRHADAELQRKELERQFHSQKDGRDVQSDRPL